MKLIYTSRQRNQTEVIHRFDVLGEFLPRDLDVMKNSLQFFFGRLSSSSKKNSKIPGKIFPTVVLDFSESTIRINEAKLQVFVADLKTAALASHTFLSIAQTDIESMHAEQNVIEQAMLAEISVLENRLALVESTKNKVQDLSKENNRLREELQEKRPKIGARSIFEKLWGDS